MGLERAITDCADIFHEANLPPVYALHSTLEIDCLLLILVFLYHPGFETKTFHSFAAFSSLPVQQHLQTDESTEHSPPKRAQEIFIQSWNFFHE